MEIANPRFERGQRVRAAQNLFNDGTYSEQTANALLVRRGEAGDIVRVARKVDSGAVVYMVEFGLNQVIGCLEWELMPWCSGVKRSDGNKRIDEAFALYGLIGERDLDEPILVQPGLRGCAIA